MRVGVVALLVLVLGLGSAFAAWAGPKDEYRMSLVVGPRGPWGEGAQRFIDTVRAKSGGRINIKPYFAGSLLGGGQVNEFDLLKDGRADFALGSTINWSPRLDPLNLFSLPFFFPSYKSLDAVTGGRAGRMIVERLEREGVVFLGWGENGYRELTNRVRPIVKPEDLEGLRIRVVGTALFRDTFKALGVEPVFMNWSETQIAFQQGTVDGQENAVSTVVIPYRMWQYHKNITLWHQAIDPLILAVNAKAWRSFSGDQRKLIREAAQEALTWEKARAREGLTGEMAALKKLEAEGMKVVRLDQEQFRAFQEKVKEVWTKWTPKIGEKLFRTALKEAGSAR